MKDRVIAHKMFIDSSISRVGFGFIKAILTFQL